MKNRVILNSQGIPVVPPPDQKSKEIAVQVARSDLKRMMLANAMAAFTQGFEAACDCLDASFKKGIEAGHNALSLEDGVKLIVELRKIGVKNAQRYNAEAIDPPAQSDGNGTNPPEPKS